MITRPTIDERKEQPYAGIRTMAYRQEFDTIIPYMLDEVFVWLEEQGIEPAGPPFMRYHDFNVDSRMDVELGVPVATAIAGNGRVAQGCLPAGRYAALVYTDILNDIEANRALIEWASEQGLKWDTWKAKHGHVFRSRVEFFLTDPDDEPDPANWKTEVAIRLADASPPYPSLPR